MGEEQYTNWLRNEYLNSPWNVWWVGVSTVPGILPNANPQESYHNSIKESKFYTGLRQPVDELCETTFQELLLLDADKLARKDISPQKGTPIIPAELYTTANYILNNPQYCFKTVCEEGKQHIAYMNTWEFKNKKVTAQRVTKYECGLQGKIGKPKDLAEYKWHFQSLHKTIVWEDNKPDSTVCPNQLVIFRIFSVGLCVIAKAFGKVLYALIV